MLRTVFFGTPEFAVPTLAALAEASYAPLLVVTQPARPAGRGRKLQDPPVALWARRHGLAVRQAAKVNEESFMAALAELAPEVAVVVAFGQIFRPALLELPRHGCLNLHASLLPRHRGAAPIQAAIAAGETRTGVTTMKMEAGLDTGPVLLQAELAIGPRETAGELAPRLAELGAGLMVETLRRLEAAALEPRPQDDALATYAPRITKADAEVDWRAPAPRIYDRLRAFTPWPLLVAELRGEPLRILAARVLAERPGEEEPGTILGLVEDHLGVRCGGPANESGTMLGLARVQRPGRRGVGAADFVNGERLRPGERFRLSSPRPSPSDVAPR
jgi:methionyl-tRNA formyltransferase